MLSNRLLSIANLLKKALEMSETGIESNSFSCLADIGCDHAYLPIYLVQEGVVDKAIASDVNKEPLARGLKHIQEVGLEQDISTRLSNGLESFEPGEIDVLTCAGMGGHLMLDILEANLDLAKGLKALVLQPQSDIPLFRRRVIELGFSIVAEDCILEDGKYYFPMLLVPVENKLEYDDIDYEYGFFLVKERNQIMFKFLQDRQRNLSTIISSMPDGVSEDRIRSLQDDLNNVNRLLKNYED